MRHPGFALATASAVALVLAGCGASKVKTVTVTPSTTQPAASTPATTSSPPPTTTAASSAAVLGSTSFAPNGTGFGSAQPAVIFNGGDPSGRVSQISWSGWGGATATGQGMSSIFKPGGGYYPQLVPVQLRAQDLGSCTPGGPSAYRQLYVREPSAPGGPLGAWSPWGGGNGGVCSPP